MLINDDMEINAGIRSKRHLNTRKLLPASALGTDADIASTEDSTLAHELLKEKFSKLLSDNSELMQGMFYASSVQQALLPQERHFNRHFKEYFVLYKPQQHIGGDLYWIGAKDDKVYFAAADCTGHGVSGAILSVLAISFLNYIVLGKEHSHLGEVIEEIDRKWIEAFNHSQTLRDTNNDWMELSLCCYDKRTRELSFAGANNNLFVVANDELTVVDGNSYPVGGWQIEKDRRFKEQKIVLPENTMVYLGSDGYKDQFGGVKGKRFMRKGLKALLHDVSYLPAKEQKKLIAHEFEIWKGSLPQTDDVCVMGIRL